MKSNVQVNGLEFGTVKGGVLTWLSREEAVETEVMKAAKLLREYCINNRGKNIIVGTNAQPRCTCPFAAANHANAIVPWCSIYGSPDGWSYFEKAEGV